MSNTKASNKESAKFTSVGFTKNAWEDYSFWQKEDEKIFNQINDLIKECLRDPFRGTGKPEPLKYNYTGYWSRRITREHRLVYLPSDNSIYIVSCRYHYN